MLTLSVTEIWKMERIARVLTLKQDCKHENRCSTPTVGELQSH